MELKYKTWHTVPIKQFFILQSILNKEQEEWDKNIDLITFFTDVPREELLKKTVKDINEILTDITQFFQKDIKKELNKTTLSSIKIDNINYKINKDVSKLSVSQFVDLQTYLKEGKDENMAKILSVFLIPNNKTYNEDYDIQETIKLFENNIDIITGRSLINFFIEALRNSTKCTMQSFRLLMMWQMWRARVSKESRNKMQKVMKDLIGCI